jgi:heme-degrading monooxygenase HmoA
MIAQVFTLSGPPPGDAPALGAAAQAAMKETRDADGCEGLYLLASRDGGDGFAIVLWRDEAALSAMRKREEEHLDEIRAESPNLPPVPQPKLYDVVTA